MSLTKSQQRAVDSRASEIVVSAGAGSGKTHVLTQRIITRLCNEPDFSLSRLLVVTFTKAAAAEMRTRIAKAIIDKIAEGDSSSEHLRRQLGLLSTAHIETVHAFCGGFLRKNFNLCGLPPDFVIDNTTAESLKDQVAEDVLSELYANPPEGFSQLLDTLCSFKNDKMLLSTIVTVYDKLQCREDPLGWLDRQVKADEGDAKKTKWYAYAFSSLKNQLCGTLALIDRAEKSLEASPDLLALMRDDINFFRTAVNTLSGLADALDWDACFSFLSSLAFPRKPAVRGGGDENYSALRDKIKKNINSVKERIFYCRTTDPEFSSIDNVKAFSALRDAVRLFSERFSAEKQKRRIVDFNDLEHLTLKILEENKIKPEFDEILVDEYQDTNGIQDRIFELLAPKNGSVFRVGDIKQSIYGFRLADPEIFREYYKSPGKDRECIDMSENFRSRPEVLNLCNHIFRAVMSETLGGIAYEGGQLLVPHRPALKKPCELCLIDTAGHSDSDDEQSSVEIEAKYVAAKIRELMATQTVPENPRESETVLRSARAEDFAILLSSYSSNAGAFKAALEKEGISSSVSEEKDLQETVEGSVIISLLRIIDNPRQDIPLVSVLRSPFFAFTPDDLAEARAECRNGDFWDSVLACAEKGNEKCRGFLRSYKTFADFAKTETASRLLRHIYNETGAYGIFSALPDADNRRKSLDLLENTALSFENGSFCACHDFVAYLDRTFASGNDPVFSSGGGVSILSVHKSKGLEYPFVFVCNLGKRFNIQDTTAPILIHKDLGIAMSYIDREKKIRLPSAKKRTVAEKIRSELVSEELRVLYVAFTRAKERLFLVMSRDGLGDEIRTISAQFGTEPAPEQLALTQNAKPWLISALLSHPDAHLLRKMANGEEHSAREGGAELVCSYTSWAEINSRTSEKIAENAENAALNADLSLCEREYAYKDISAIPSKMTPTGSHAKRNVKGMFERGSKDALLRGTAVHELLSKADLAKCATPEGLSSEKARLCAQDADERMITGFCRSELAKRALCSDEMYREYRFGVLLSPDELENNGITDEKVLVNGSIDMLFFENGKAVIIDFKTDSVKSGYEKEAAENHRFQLDIYEKAVKAVFETEVSEKYVYFLKTSTAVRL